MKLDNNNYNENRLNMLKLIIIQFAKYIFFGKIQIFLIIEQWIKQIVPKN